MDLDKPEKKSNRCDPMPVFFDLLNNEQREAVAANRFEMFFKTGETLVKQGSALTHVIYILEGNAKVLLEGNAGHVILLKILKRQALIGGPGFNTDSRHHFSVVALDDTRACLIGVDFFKYLISSVPAQALAMKLITDLNDEIINLYDRLKCLTHKHMNGRLADTLLYLSEDVYQSPEFTTLLSRSDIANMSCMTNESAIRTLKDFRDDGIIDCKGDYFRILKRDVLVDISRKG